MVETNTNDRNWNVQNVPNRKKWPEGYARLGVGAEP